MNLSEKLAKVQQDLQIEKSKVEDRNIELIRELEEQEAKLLEQMMLEESGQAVNESTPTVQIPEIILEHDLNAAFNHPHANEYVIQLIKAGQAQLASEYEKEITAIREEHKREIEIERLHQEELKQQSEKIKAETHENTAKMYELLHEVEDLKVVNKDLEEKRDAAARELDEANDIKSILEHKIELLEKEIESLKTKLSENKPVQKPFFKPTTDLGALLINPLKNSAEETRTDLPKLPPLSEILEKVNPFPSVQGIPVGEGSSGVVSETIENKIRVLEDEVADTKRRLAILEAASIISKSA